MYLERMKEGMEYDTPFHYVVSKPWTAITELIGEQAIIWLNDKLPCLDRSASSVMSATWRKFIVFKSWKSFITMPMAVLIG